MSDKWQIFDWTGKVLWNGREFNSFEEGWDFLYANDPCPQNNTDEPSPVEECDYEHYYDDYYVEPSKKGAN